MAATMNNFVGDGNGYVGNPDLEPEAADTVSATLTWHSADRRRELRIAPYYTRVDDYIDAVRRMMFTPGNFNVLTYANQSARLQGIDLSGRAPLGQTSIGEFGLQASVSYVDGRNRVSGDDLYNIMPLNARCGSRTSGGWDNPNWSPSLTRTKSPTCQLIRPRATSSELGARATRGISGGTRGRNPARPLLFAAARRRNRQPMK